MARRLGTAPADAAEPPPSFYRQRCRGDGGCLFRAVATAAFFAHTGYNLGGGAPDGAERSVADVVHNCFAALLRQLGMGAVCTERTLAGSEGLLPPSMSSLDEVMDMYLDVLLAFEGQV